MMQSRQVQPCCGKAAGDFQSCRAGTAGTMVLDQAQSLEPQGVCSAAGSGETISHQHRKPSAWQQVRQLSPNSSYANSCLLLGFNMLCCSKNNFLLDLIPLAGVQSAA